jgi:SH3-like domain-containing protein
MLAGRIMTLTRQGLTIMRIAISSLLVAAAMAAGAFAAMMVPSEAFAQASSPRGPSGLPLPRFVSLKAQQVNLRIGPSIDHAISWRYTRSGVPMEIIQEYDNWRRVRDADGTEGWINQALLTGERTAVTAPWMRGRDGAVHVLMHSESGNRGRLVAKLEPGVIVSVRTCTGEWCQVSVKGAEGWIAQREVWGAYPGEAFR